MEEKKCLGGRGRQLGIPSLLTRAWEEGEVMGPRSSKDLAPLPADRQNLIRDPWHNGWRLCLGWGDGICSFRGQGEGLWTSQQ